MAKQPPKYDTLAAFLSSTGYDTVDAQFVIHRIQEVSPPTPYHSSVFRANYFTFVLLKEGYSSYTLDNRSYAVKPNTLYFTNPGHLKSFVLQEGINGFLISFSEAYLRTYIADDIFTIFPYLLSEIVPPLYLDAELFNSLWELCLQMMVELKKDGQFSAMMVASYFKILLLKINENRYADYNPIEEGDRNSEIVRTFKINLEQHLQDLLAGKAAQIHQVIDFADLQYLHPNYFSTVIKTKTGKTVSEWITVKIIQEAKSQLSKSKASIKEIAFSLGFKEANYFSKYFKKNTGITPGLFRKTQS